MNHDPFSVLPVGLLSTKVGGGTGKFELSEGDHFCQLIQNQSRLYSMGLADTLTLSAERDHPWLNLSSIRNY